MDHDDLDERLARDLDGTFEALVRAHQDRLFSIALRLTGDAHDAEELVQDTFVRAYRALGGYEPERIRDLHLRPWLARIVINLCRNRARRRGDRPLALAPFVGVGAEPAADPAAGPEAATGRRAETERWAGLLLGLPARYRVPVVLRHIDDLSYAEMSEALGRAEGTLKAQVHRGLALLRAAYDAAERKEMSA